ncbi:hypothetical protein F9K72_05345 [Brucella intermedia]|nr:hypothetical protein F9K72_05345 [Brucella intermedia]KAB2713070.1 hypothetical protein F9K80_00170 [Brucella intermedia]MPR62259.1 hypothetical protein [Brucella intermedia]HCH72532.1 hypothetical protein [Ochrobactrum sp.]
MIRNDNPQQQGKAGSNRPFLLSGRTAIFQFLPYKIVHKSGSDHGKDAVSNVYLLVVPHCPTQDRFALLLEMLQML